MSLIEEEVYNGEYQEELVREEDLNHCGNEEEDIPIGVEVIYLDNM